MAEKKMDNPLENLGTFDPGKVKKIEQGNGTGVSLPISPLGSAAPPALPDGPLPTSMEALWQETHREMEQLRLQLVNEKEKRREFERKSYELETAVKLTNQSLADFDKERQIRLGLEREISALEVQARDVKQLQETLEREREMRLQLEKKLSALEVKAERAEQWADQLAEERKARLDLERKTATLQVEVQSAAKIEALLDEERKARMNAQSRAATAEAKLARFEGELMTGQQGKKGLFGRK
jgi:hypothetical protein